MKIIEKPWGSETILEINEHYMCKLLYMKKGCRCSLQYHNIKTETIYVLSGKLRIVRENNESSDHLKGDYITLLPKQVHRMEGVEDSYYLEMSTPEMEDVIRIEDDYGRTI